VALPRFLIRLIDPASAHLDQPPPREPVHREAVVFGPGGSRPATDEELAEMRTTAARHRADHEAAVADARVRWAAELRWAGLIRFWHGDDVLHLVTDGHGESIARVSRKQRSADVLLEDLTREAARA
jgi:hypothetical protein